VSVPISKAILKLNGFVLIWAQELEALLNAIKEILKS